jgi:hypothetical protein
MSIDANEIEKYIFDPENPRQCRSYNLLLNISKKEPYSFISPEFLMYFYKNDIFNSDFKSHLWDIPDNYEDLSELEKMELFKNQLSENELKDYINNLDIRTEKILKYKFLQEQIEVNPINFFNKDICKLDLINDFYRYIKFYLLRQDNELGYIDEKYTYDFNYIIFSKNYFSILLAEILRSSIFITLEENIETFFTYEQNNNIKPIFLKKIEDINLLLTVLNQDLKQNNSLNQTREISYIKSIEINDFYSIKNINLENLADKKEIYILGENGDGKITVFTSFNCWFKRC